MKKTFLKSVVTGIVGLTIVSGCGMMGKKSAHKCSANSCKAKQESHSCKSKKDTNSCRAKKNTNSCSAKSGSNTCKGQK
jgi:hypothetical protein